MPNKIIQRTVKSGVSLRSTVLLTAADARRYVAKESMLKFLIFIIITLFSVSSYACFSPPPGLIEEHAFQAKVSLSIAVVFLTLSIVLRLLSNRKRIWVPLLFVTTFTYWPAYLWHWGQAYSGACGNPEVVLAFKILACGFGVLFIYESLYFYKARRSKAT